LLGNRERQILDWIARIGAADARQVMARFGLKHTAAYERLKPLVEMGLLDHHRLLHLQPGLYFATAKGLRTCGLEQLPVHRVGVSTFAHDRAVASAAVGLHRGLPEWELLGERELRALEAECGHLVGSVRLREGAVRPAFHRPDLLLHRPAGGALAIEVELSVKAQPTLQSILRAYARARHLAGVYYLADRRPAAALERAAQRVRATPPVTVLRLEQVDLLVQSERREAGGG
jgi:hypothetical protein